jgi:FlaA1/EpsC-like NDP-sugar epimerase
MTHQRLLRTRSSLHVEPFTLGVQAALAFAACELAFFLLQGPHGGAQAARAAAATVMFVLALAACGAARPVTDLALDVRDVWTAVGAAAIGSAGATAVAYLVRGLGLDAKVAVVAGGMLVLFVLAQRAAEISYRRRCSERRPGVQRTIVVGSGKAAESLVRLVQENHNFRYAVIGCVDDAALAARVAGKPLLGGIDDLPRLIDAHKIGCVIIAIPSAPPHLVKRIMGKCLRESGPAGNSPAVKILPGVLELLNDGVRVSRIRPVQPEDLLPRDPVRVDLSEIRPHVENRVILVTGAGGSIGSELCRQICALNPSLLLLLGHGENSLFAINQELRLKYGFTRTRIVLADVADAARIRTVFSHYRPHVVFHAAAHKHVPIVEANVCEAARNNVLGTHVVALAAAAVGTAKFVLLSTDKAVNPTSVMGATKRLAEIISQSFVNQTGTEFVTVRFGNVLESRGSVIPIFKKQIEHGGPVTVTHRDMRRYFMTIPEAVSLVLQAMAIGRDGQVLVLDMGKPVNILKLAETLITLSGLTPYRDIPIVETGIRPGEKLFEEILTTTEGMSKTSHERLFIAQQERVAYETLAAGLRTLETAARAGDQDTVIEVLRNFVPSYHPGSHLLNGEAHATSAPGAVGADLSAAQSHLAAEAVIQANGHPNGLAGGNGVAEDKPQTSASAGVSS